MTLDETPRPNAQLTRLGDLICDQYRDTRHFRIHFSTRSGHVETDSPPRDIAIAGDHAFLAVDAAGLAVLDVSNPRDPLAVGHLETPGRALGIAAQPPIVFLAADGAGLLVIDVTAPDSPRLIGSLPIPGAHRVRAAGERVYVAGSSALSVVDVTVPSTPRLLSTLALPWEVADFELAGQYVHLAADTVLVIADVSIPEALHLAGGLVLPGRILDVDHGRDGYLQALGRWPGSSSPVDGYGLWTVDVSVATRPTLARTTPLDGQFEAILTSGYFDYVAGLTTLLAVDLGDPAHPRPVDSCPIRGHARGMARSGDILLVLDRDGVQVVDVTDLRAPRVAWDQLPGWPELGFVDDVGEMLEAAYTLFHDSLGLRPPEPDGDAGGGVDLVDCYVYWLEFRTWGFARREERRDNGCRDAYSGYFTLDTGSIPGYMPPDELAVHEYFHVVQFAHGGWGSWFMESTASWAPFAVAPESRSWLWAVDSWFHRPHLPLWDTWFSPRRYGSVHYWLFHTETTDRSFVPDVWARCCQADWLDALRDELTERGRDFDETLVEFSIWNAITGARDDGAHYRFGRDLPQVRLQARHENYPVIAAEVPLDVLAWEAGSNYVRFMGPGATDRLAIDFDGLPQADRRRVSFVATGRDNRHTSWTLSPDLDGDCSIVIPDWSSCSDVTMIVTNFADLTENREYTYSAYEEGPVVPPDLVLVTPNPTRMGASFVVRSAEETPARLIIFDASGRAVREITQYLAGRGYHVISWDGLRERRHPTSAGVYFYDLRIGGRSATGRLVRLR